SDETWGIVINEAMASGLVIFSSKNAGASSILVKDNINGHVFDPDNVDELVKLFDSVLDGQINLEKMKMNSKKIISEFDSGKVSNIILEAVKSVRCI
ncbi:MAG: glycosyltransferase, partial [Acidobacteriota bacterium]